MNIDEYLIENFGEINSTIAKGDLTATEVKEELHISNPKFFDLLNNLKLRAYYVGSQIRVHREDVVKYKMDNAYVPTDIH